MLPRIATPAHEVRLYRSARMRPTLKLVPRTEPPVQGAAQVTKGLPTGANFSMLVTATGACQCGPGRSPTSRFTCITCARAARYFTQLQQRNADRRRGLWG